MNPEEEMARVFRRASRDMTGVAGAFSGLGRAIEGAAAATGVSAEAMGHMISALVSSRSVARDPVGDSPPVTSWSFQPGGAMNVQHGEPSLLTILYDAEREAGVASPPAPSLRAIVSWPDGETQEWAVPVGERAAVEAALAASGATYTIAEGGA